MVKQQTILMILIVIFIALFLFVSDIKKPLEELSKLPRCKNDVIITNDLKMKIINYSNERIIAGTGKDYFGNHFLFTKLDYDIEECIFIVRYEYVYDELHAPMSMTVKVINPNEFTIVDTNVFLRPIYVLVDEDTAKEIAAKQNVSYDYYNLEIDVPTQTIYYRFYKESETGETDLVLEVDAQSKQITLIKKPKPIVPIV